MKVESSPKLLLSQGRIKDELCLHNGCLLYMMYPSCSPFNLGNELHEAHPGVSQMKNLAQPGMLGRT